MPAPLLDRRRLPAVGIVATLAVAFAATILVLGLIHSYLLGPLPFGDADRLVVINEYPLATRPAGGLRVTFGNAADITERTTAFSRLAIVRNESLTLHSAGGSESIFVQRVTPDFFALLSARPRHGELIDRGNAELGGQRALVLSHELWQRRFGGDPAIVGQSVQLERASYRVVGITPANLSLPIVGDGQQAWIAMLPVDFDRAERRVARHFVLGELAPGRTLAAANAELAALAATLGREFPATNTDRGFHARTLREALIGGFRPQLLLLQAAVLLVLLVACVNVACLLLAQAIRRRREFAVRLALGAGWHRLFAQFFGESFRLAGTGALLGLLLAAWLAPLTASLLPLASDLRRLPPPSVGPGVAVAALVLAVLIAVVFSLVPLWHARRLHIEATLRDGARSLGSSSTGGATRALVACQVALALALVVTAVQLVRSFRAVQHVDRGIAVASLQTFRMGVRGPGAADLASRHRWTQSVLDRLAALPQVASCAASDFAYPEIPGTYSGFTQEADTLPVTQSPKRALRRAATPELLATAGLRLREGRWLDTHDRTDSRRVAVISRSLADKHWPAGDALGRRVRLEGGGDAPWEIVGIVDDWLSHGSQPRAIDTFYVPFAHFAPFDTAVFVRTHAGQRLSADEINRLVSGIDPNGAAYFHRHAADFYAESAWQTRFGLTLVTLFAALAVTLCLTGVYAVLAFAVAGRTPEFGLRFALGATPADVARLVLHTAVALVWPGLVAGLAVAWFASRATAHLLYGVSAVDALSFLVTPLLLALACVLAASLPARRATKVDPLVALRSD